MLDLLIDQLDLTLETGHLPVGFLLLLAGDLQIGGQLGKLVVHFGEPSRFGECCALFGEPLDSGVFGLKIQEPAESRGIDIRGHCHKTLMERPEWRRSCPALTSRTLGFISMERVRQAFLDTSDVSIALLRSDEVARSWDRPSALAQWSVSGLVGHLARQTILVEQYLDADPHPQDEAISPAAYYTAAVDTDDLDSELHRSIRQRGEDAAAEGHAALIAQLDEVMGRLPTRLNTEPPERRIRVHKDIVLLLDDYLATRLLELTCHIDDVAISVGLDTPQMPSAGLDIAIRALVAIGRHRHGELAVLRALARRERDTADALHVL